MTRKSGRSKNLDDDSIKVIVAIIDGWVGTLTWNLLILKIEVRLRNKYERQTLSAHTRILTAFQNRKISLRSSESDTVPKSPEKLSPVEVTMLSEKLSKVTAENSRLKMENDRLLEQFAVWAYNANARNLTLEILSLPLPPIDRDVSTFETKKSARKHSR